MNQKRAYHFNYNSYDSLVSESPFAINRPDFIFRIFVKLIFDSYSKNLAKITNFISIVDSFHSL